MKNGKNGKIIDRDIPYESEIGAVYGIGFICGIIGFIISITNNGSIFIAFIAFAIFYYFGYVIGDVSVGGLKFTSLQMVDYDLPGGAVSPEELYSKIVSMLSSCGKLEFINRNLKLIESGLEYWVKIDYQKNNFRIIITKKYPVSFLNDSRTSRYNKAIIIIPKIVYAVQKYTAELNGLNNTVARNNYNSSENSSSDSNSDTASNTKNTKTWKEGSITYIGTMVNGKIDGYGEAYNSDDGWSYWML